MPEVVTKVEGMKEVLSALQGVARIPNSDIHRVMAETVLSQTQLRFQAERAPDGSRWAKSRRAADEGGKTLQDKRRLFQSIVSKYSEMFGKVGSNVVYAAIHQFGGEIVPVEAGALAIPMTDEARRYGYARRFPRPLHLVWKKGEKSGWLIELNPDSPDAVDLWGDGTMGVRQYLLLRKVTIPAREWLGVNGEDESMILGAVLRLIRNRAAGG